MEIHRADLAYRRRSLWLWSAIACLCAIGLWHWHEWLRVAHERIAGGDAEQARRWLRWTLGALLLAPVTPLLLWGRGLRRLGQAAWREQRFPPRAWKTWRDVRVLRDRAARDWARRTRRLGLLAQSAAGLLAAAALALWGRLS